MSRWGLSTFVLFGVALLYGQGTDLGSIRGVVTDPAGSTVPGATVTITDVSTDARVVVQTNSGGEYEANSLKSGDYKVMIAAAGFRSVEISGVTLRTGTSARADAKLEIAGTVVDVAKIMTLSLVDKLVEEDAAVSMVTAAGGPAAATGRGTAVFASTALTRCARSSTAPCA